MTDTAAASTVPGGRIGALLLRPTEAWNRIANVSAEDEKCLLIRYAVPLAAIGPIASLIGNQLVPMRIFGAVLRPSLTGAVTSAVVAWALALVGVVVLALVIDALASPFGGIKDRRRAMQVAVYSSTASWLSGVFGILPALMILSLVGLYSLFLLYKGLPIVMKTPADKALGYTASVVVAALVISVMTAVIAGGVASMFTAGSGIAGLGGI